MRTLADPRRPACPSSRGCQHGEVHTDSGPACPAESVHLCSASNPVLEQGGGLWRPRACMCTHEGTDVTHARVYMPTHVHEHTGESGKPSDFELGKLEVLADHICSLVYNFCLHLGADTFELPVHLQA